MDEQLKAVTKDGRSVLLNNDGTWEYAKQIVQHTSDAAFRKASWGMSRDEVRQLETNTLLQETINMLIYDGVIADLQANIVFVFAEDQLVRGKYRITEEHANQNEYLTDYDALKEPLCKKYGTPYKDDTFWLNSLFRDEYQDWGVAVGMGHLSMYARWQSESTEVILYLNGDNHQISLGIEYQSRKLIHIEERAKEAELLADL